MLVCGEHLFAQEESVNAQGEARNAKSTGRENQLIYIAAFYRMFSSLLQGPSLFSGRARFESILFALCA